LEKQKDNVLFLNKIIETFPQYTKQKFTRGWEQSQLKTRIPKLRDFLLKYLEAQDADNSLEFMDHMYKGLQDDDVILPEHQLFRGSLIMVFSALNYYLGRTRDLEIRNNILDTGKAQIASIVKTISNESLQLIAEIEGKNN